MGNQKNPPGWQSAIKSEVMTEKQAAAYAGVSPQFLRSSRHYGHRKGYAEAPPFIRLGGGRSIRYLKKDIDKWLSKHRCYPTNYPADV